MIILSSVVSLCSFSRGCGARSNLHLAARVQCVSMQVLLHAVISQSKSLVSFDMLAT
jgi:hypothetical protein